MPLIYGEGGPNAFRRLEKEIEIQYGISLKGSKLATKHDLRNLSAMPIDVDHITDSGYGGSSAIKSQSHGKVPGESPPMALVEAIPESQAESAAYETQTIYSDTESLRDPELLEYVTAFADELYGSLPSGFDKAEFERVLPVLDGLLRTFAFNMGYDGSTHEHRNLMYLVHRYRR